MCRVWSFIQQVKPLDESVLLPTPEEGKTNINIISLASLGDDVMGTIHKKAVGASVLRTLDTHMAGLGGDQANPVSMLIIDEASAMLPKTASNVKTGYDMTSVSAVEHMMKVGRSKGFCVVLATQAPSDLNAPLLKLIEGPRFIGKCRIAVASDKDAIKNLAGHVSMGKQSGKKHLRDAQSELADTMAQMGPGQFLYYNSTSKPTDDIRKIQAPATLKRKRESEALWLGDNSKLKDWYVDDEDGKRSRVY